MIKMACTRKTLVHTAMGNTVSFPGNKQIIEVPDHLVEECMKAGAYILPSEKYSPPDLSAEPAAKIELIPAERRKRAMALFEEMINSPEEHRTNFTAVGRPSTRYVERRLGFKIDSREIESWWEEAKPR